MPISPEQTRAARGLLGWSQTQLANAADVSRATLSEFELGRRQPVSNNRAAIRAALEAAGVVILDAGQCQDGGPGVRLRQVRQEPVQPADGEAGIIKNNEM